MWLQGVNRKLKVETRQEDTRCLWNADMSLLYMTQIEAISQRSYVPLEVGVRAGPEPPATENLATRHATLLKLKTLKFEG